MQNIIIGILSFFDFYHKKKILNFLKEKNLNNFDIVFDIGAHKGETINLFIKNFRVNKIYSFEASPINFKILKKKNIKHQRVQIILENIAVGSKNGIAQLKQVQESSSSTLSHINLDSNYFKKKKKILNFFSNKEYFHNIEVEIKTLNKYLDQNLIKFIDFLKIDTEGYEFEVLLGLKDKLKNVKIILFEHHFDDMLKKNYTFRDINSLLIQNSFRQIYKSKMPFRKTFEYIYINTQYE